MPLMIKERSFTFAETERKTNPSIIQRIDMESKNGKRIFNINLSQENFDFFCGGCERSGCLIGATENGIIFKIFPDGSRMPTSFDSLPNNEGYYAYFGLPIERGEISYPITLEKLKEFSQKRDIKLKNSINSIKEIPIFDKKISDVLNLGFVNMQIIEKDK